MSPKNRIIILMSTTERNVFIFFVVGSILLLGGSFILGTNTRKAAKTLNTVEQTQQNPQSKPEINIISPSPDISPIVSASASPTTPPLPSPIPIIQNSLDQLTLPVRPSSPSAQTVSIVYLFVGKISSTKSTSQGVEFTLDVKTIPTLLACSMCQNKTAIVFLNKGVTSNANLTDITVGKNVRVTAAYDITKKIWNTNKITLIQKPPK